MFSFFKASMAILKIIYVFIMIKKQEAKFNKTRYARNYLLERNHPFNWLLSTVVFLMVKSYIIFKMTIDALKMKTFKNIHVTGFTFNCYVIKSPFKALQERHILWRSFWQLETICCANHFAHSGKIKAVSERAKKTLQNSHS